MITFEADHVKISGPNAINGNITITFETGEYSWDNIKDLPNLNGESILVSVSKYDTQRSNSTQKGNGA